MQFEKYTERVRKGELPLLRVRHGAKGGKARNVPLPHRTFVRLDRYQADRAQLLGPTPGP